MRIIKRGVGNISKVAANVSVKMEMVQGDRTRATIDKPKETIDQPNDRPVYRNVVLEELSAAAREALNPKR